MVEDMDTYLSCISKANEDCEGEVKARAPIGKNGYWESRCEGHQQKVVAQVEELEALRRARS